MKLPWTRRPAFCTVCGSAMSETTIQPYRVEYDAATGSAIDGSRKIWACSGQPQPDTRWLMFHDGWYPWLAEGWRLSVTAAEPPAAFVQASVEARDRHRAEGQE